MNTHDIELPPNPITPMLAALIDKASGAGTSEAIWQLMQEFANQAIEAYRKRKGEVVVTKTPEGEIIAVTRQDDEGRILSVIAEADSKRRGEPVGYIMPTALKQLKAGGNAIVGGLSQGGDVAVYLVPQPAEPTAKQSLTQDEIQLANWLLRDPTNGERLVFASEPVNEGSFSHVRMRSESGEDWTLTVRLKQGWLTAEQRAANFWSAAKAEEQPAEPVERGPCSMGVGCDEVGVCYAEAHDRPEECGKQGETK